MIPAKRARRRFQPAVFSTAVSLALVVGAAACAGTAAPSSGGDLPPSSLTLCGAVPESVPCIDTAATDPMPTPVGPTHQLGGTCGARFSADRCQAMAFAAADQLGASFGDVVAIDIVPDPDPPPGGIDFAHRTFVEITLADQGRRDAVISCPGIAAAFDPACMPEPVVQVGSPRSDAGGYTDVPDGSTPFPSLDPTAVANARPLRIAQLVVPVTALGPQKLVLGRALLPNGYLSHTSIELSDPWPSNVLFRKSVQMVITPVPGGSPMWNLYESGWHRGTVEVEASLTFDVGWFEPGASFTVVNVVVR